NGDREELSCRKVVIGALVYDTRGYRYRPETLGMGTQEAVSRTTLAPGRQITRLGIESHPLTVGKWNAETVITVRITPVADAEQLDVPPLVAGVGPKRGPGAIGRSAFSHFEE